MKFEKMEAKLAKRKAAKEKRVAETKVYAETDTWTEFELRMSAKGAFPKFRFMSRYWWDYVFSNNGWPTGRLGYALPVSGLLALCLVALLSDTGFAPYWVSVPVAVGIVAVGAFATFWFKPWVESVRREIIGISDD